MIKQSGIESLSKGEHIKLLIKSFDELNSDQTETQFYKDRKLKGIGAGLDEKGGLVYQSELNTKGSG